MRWVRSVGVVVGLFVLLQCGFFGLLVLGAAVPDSAVAQALVDDLDERRYGPRSPLAHVPTAKTVVIAAVAVLTVIAVCVVLLRARTEVPGRTGSRIVVGATLAVPALIPVVWYEVLKNHSQIHEFFTYRSLPVALGVVLFASVSAGLTPGRSAAEVDVLTT